MVTGNGEHAVLGALPTGPPPALLRRLTPAVAGTLILASLWLPQPAGTDRAVAAGIVALATIVAMLLVDRGAPEVLGALSPWLPVGFVMAFIAATGGNDSVYHDLYAIVLVITALVTDLRRVVLAAVVVAVAASTPFFYDAPATPTMVTDVVADLAVWVAIAVLVATQSGALRRREQELDGRDREQRRLITEQERLLAQLQHLDRSRAAFIRNVGHEVRTPLTVIQGGLELIEEHGAGHPATTRMLPAMNRSVTRLHNLLLDLTDLRSGPVTGRVTEVGLQALLHDVLARHDLGSRSRSVDLPPVRVRVEEEPLRRALGHLLANVARHTPDDPSVEVAVSAVAYADGWLDLTVADSGPGFGEGAPHELLAPFAQGAHVANDARPGAGLGLAIVDQAAKAHGGHVDLYDGPGGGAVVILRLPDVVVTSSGPLDEAPVDRGAPATADDPLA